MAAPAAAIAGGSLARMRAALDALIESQAVQRALIGLVVLNAIVLGLETVPQAMAAAGPALLTLDRVILSLFVAEMVAKLFARGARFFRSGWNLFDLTVIAIALVPASGPLAVFRALRVLRILRLVSAIPKMRMMVESLVRSLPGMGAISLLLLIFFYVFAVVATKLFGADHPQWFGSLTASAFTLFQIMTLEGWADIAREVMTGSPGAWLFFLSFILLATFTVLNLFIGLIVKAMEEPIASDARTDSSDAGESATRAEIAALRDEIAALRKTLAATRASEDQAALARGEGSA